MARHCAFVMLAMASAIAAVDAARTVHLQITDYNFEKCPHVQNSRDIIDRRASSLSFRQTGVRRVPAGGDRRLSHVRIDDADGKAQFVTLPGCFQLQMDVKFNKDIRNPYVETFVNIGADEKPCDDADNNPYCPPSRNPVLRFNTNNQKTCRFCDLCGTADHASEQVKQQQRQASIRAGNNVCPKVGEKIRAGQKYPITLTNICTPTQQELEDKLNEKYGDRWRSYQHLVKTGSIVLTVHILNRRQAIPSNCLQLGRGQFKWRGPSSLWPVVKRKLERNCHRYRQENVLRNGIFDDYLACYYGHINYKIR